MHITTDRAFVPAGAPAVRYLHIVINAPGEKVVMARDVALEIAVDPGVEAVLINDLPFERQIDRLTAQLGNLVSDQEVSLVVAVAFKGTQEAGTALGVACRVMERDGVIPNHPMEVRWTAVDAAQDAKQPVNGDVILAAASVLAERARQVALAANAAGRFEAATRIIQDVLNDLQAFAQEDRRVLEIIDLLQRDAREFGEAM